MLEPHPPATCQIFSSFSDIEDQRAAWDAFAESTGAPIYMSYDWCKIWWQFFGRRRRLALCFVRAGQELIGLFPMYIDAPGRSPFRIRIARVIGATDGPTRLLDPPVRADKAALAIRTLAESLTGQGLCDLVSLGTVKASYPGLAEIAAGEEDTRLRARIRPAGVVTVFDLSERPADYLTKLGPGEQKKRRYDFRYLARHGAKESVIAEPGAALSRDFQEFVRMHTVSWEAKGRPGHFRAWPQAPEYQKALAERSAELNRLRLFKIEVGGDAICYDYGFVFGRSFFWELPARSLDRTWTKISLGSCALITMLRQAVEEGITTLYAGVGQYDYKTRLGAEEQPVVTARFFARSPLVGLRIGVFDLFYALIEILYFKVWYMRVQPRLPRWGRRPIWKFWARMAT